MSRISLPAINAATGVTAGLFPRIKKAAGGLPQIIKVKGPLSVLAGAFFLTALSQCSLAQFNGSIDRIEGGRAIQVLPLPQSLGVYNGASVGAGRRRPNQNSAARRTRVMPVPVPRRH
jgi:hypothetical protein